MVNFVMNLIDMQIHVMNLFSRKNIQLFKMADALADMAIEPRVFKELQELGGSDPEFINVLIKSYFDQIREKQSQLEEYQLERNAVELGKVAHFLKGSSLSLGFSGLSTAFAKLQQLCSEPVDWDQITLVVDQLPLLVGACKTALENYNIYIQN